MLDARHLDYLRWFQKRSRSPILLETLNGFGMYRSWKHLGLEAVGRPAPHLMGAREWTWVPEEMHLHLQAETPITGILQQSYIYKKSMCAPIPYLAAYTDDSSSQIFSFHAPLPRSGPVEESC